ncbi:MAG: hypothetical protein ACP5QG_07510 [candidate division WOR-3 bacterium]
MPPGFRFLVDGGEEELIPSDMDISPDLSTLVVPVADSTSDVRLFLIDTSRQTSQLRDSVYVGTGQYCSRIHPRFNEDGSKIFFQGRWDGSKLLVWDLISDVVDTLMDMHTLGPFQDLLPQDTGFLCNYRPIRSYSFNTGLLMSGLPGTEDKARHIEVNPVYGEYAVCWGSPFDTAVTLYNLNDFSWKTKGISPYLNAGEIRELSWSPDGMSVVFICLGGHPHDFEVWIYRNIKDFF